MAARPLARRLFLVPIVLASCGLGHLAVESTVFAQNVRPARIEFLVLSTDGQPITDLRPDEVVVTVDGEPRTIESLRLARLDEPTSDPDAVPPPFGTNDQGAGRTIVFAVASSFVESPAGKVASDAIDRFLDQLSPGDRIGLVTIPESVVSVNPTTDVAAVRAALPGLVSAASVSPEAAAIESCAPRTVLQSLGGVISGFRALEGPKALVMMASSLPSSQGLCYLADDYDQLADELAAEEVHLYVVQVSSSASALDQGLEAVAQLAGRTVVLPVTPTSTDALGAIAVQTSAYYVATLEGRDADRGGGVHALDVRVTREGVVTRAHAAMSVPSAAVVGRAPSVPEMLKAPTRYPALPLRVATFASRGPEGRVRMLVVAGPVDPSAELTTGAVGLIDQTGSMRQVTLNENQLSASPIVVVLETEPGDFRLRFAATAEDGTYGAADVPVAARLTPIAPYTLSGLVLGVVSSGAFVPALQFGDEPVAYAYFELYGQVASGLSAVAELASSPSGEAMATYNLAGSRTPEPDKITLMAEIPTADLEPGDYVVRVVVSVEGQPDATLMRTLRKVR